MKFHDPNDANFDWTKEPAEIRVGWLDHPATLMVPILILTGLIMWYVDGGENILSYSVWHDALVAKSDKGTEIILGWFMILMLGVAAPFIISTAVIGIGLFCIIQPIINFFANWYYTKFYYDRTVQPNAQRQSSEAEALLIEQNFQARAEDAERWQRHLVRYETDVMYAKQFDIEQARIEQQNQHQALIDGMSNVVSDAVREISQQQAQAMNDFFGTGGLAPAERMMARSPLLRELQWSKLGRVIDKLDRL